MIWTGLLAMIAAGCSHTPPHQTVINFDSQLAQRVGRAKQAEILALMGEPTAQDQIGELEVWTYLYTSSGNKHRSKPEIDLVAPQHDGLILDFDRQGTLQRYHVILEGRATRRDRNKDR
jgi:outer membrane protein assembly factor BamE (lipoprotein component of BamABCDE complex)